MIRLMIERAGVQLTVRAKSAASRVLVESAMAAMRPKKVTTAHGVMLTVDGDEKEWHLRDHTTGVSRKLTSAGDLIYHLTDRIVFHIADRAEAMHCLHAAAVSHAGNALVIPANSGAGKSSFTCWLVANGFDYITDELILLDDEQRIDGVGRPIQIKSHGQAAIEPLLTAPQEVFTGKLVNAVPVSSLGGRSSESSAHPLMLLVFPQYRKGAAFAFARLSSADAGMRLMANHVNARNLEGHGFRAMMQMIRSTPAYALEYGGFANLPDDFAQQLQDLIKPA